MKKYIIHHSDWSAQTKGSKLANKGKPKTLRHRANIKRGLSKARRLQAGKILEAIKTGDDTQLKYFKTGADAARFLKCSRQLISQATKCDKGFSAKGWVFKWVKIEDVLKKVEA